MNINSDLDYFEKVDITKEKEYPIFLKKIKFENFRHIPELDIEFKNPISIVSGTNRTGKTTMLMSLACSHLNFLRRNPKNGLLERNTWSSLMKFTPHDKQDNDWTYYITYKRGNKIDKPKRGQRKAATNKWNGIGKKESQFDFRDVIFIDLDRIVPARFFNDKIYNEAKKGVLKNISTSNKTSIEKYLSYILEENFDLNNLATINDKDIFKYKNKYEYSSFNTATGEDVLTRIIIDIVEAKKNSLILIDEIEMGLHPKIQRRLMDVIRNVSRFDSKQFIITSHSSTILDSVNINSRIFIERNNFNQYKAIQNISVNAALTKMDSKSFPLIELFCEDNEAKKIVEKGIRNVGITKNLNNFKDLFNIISVGSSDKTYKCFEAQKLIYSHRKIKTGFGCILDGDMKLLKNSNGKYSFPEQDGLHFLYSNDCPEKFLTKIYLDKHPNTTIQYYYDNENPHYLFQAIIDNSDLSSRDEVFDTCWNYFLETDNGNLYLEELSEFLLNLALKYSPEL
jgi:predicted ATPase